MQNMIVRPTKLQFIVEMSVEQNKGKMSRLLLIFDLKKKFL